MAAALVAAAPAATRAAEGLDPLLAGLRDAWARQVVREPTLVRPPLPIAIRGSVKTFQFLLDRPAFAARLARHLHPPLSYRVVEKGPKVFDVDDGGLVRGELRLVADAGNRRVYLGNGQARSVGQIIRLAGRMVVLLEYQPGKGEGAPLVEATSHMFLHVEGAVMRVIAKALSRLVWGIAERRVEVLGQAAGMVAERIARDPRSLFDEMRGWPDLRPEDLEDYRRTFLP
jgi:hypothetical protein